MLCSRVPPDLLWEIVEVNAVLGRDEYLASAAEELDEAGADPAADDLPVAAAFRLATLQHSA